MLESFGPYRILNRLGSGGMGEVYLAEDRRLGRKVAVKVLSSLQAEDEENQKRLRREAQAVARLDHPNICTVYEVGEWERGTYIAMQAVEGDNLGTLLARGRLTIAEVLSIGIQAADALIEAHGKGILHRDLKPQNLMLTPRGLVKVLDFGLAKPMTKQALGESVASGVGLTIGTVPYMSPEQVRGEDLDPRSDLFSLGLVLYELATGERAFQADSAIEVMAAILREEPHGLTEGSLIHPALKPVLSQLLEKDRTLRTQSAQDLKSQLERLRLALSEGRDFYNLPTSRVPLNLRVRRLLHRVPRWALAGGVALALMGAGFTGWLLRSPLHVESIAILPIGTEAPGADVEYVADGVTEQLINQLSRLPQLRVISRTSIVRYKGQTPDLKALAKELGVDSVLTGRLLQRDGKLNLHVELVSTGDSRHLWGERFSGTLADLGMMQDQLARSLSTTLGYAGQAGTRGILTASTSKVDPEAYRLYLKGRFHQDKWTPDDFQKALAYFDQALAKDPSFALAPAAKAAAYWNMSSQFLRPVVAMAKTKEEARLALSINPELPEAHVDVAGAKAILDFDFPGAEASFKRALELDPHCVLALEYYAYALIGRHRTAEALSLLSQAQKLDPMSPILEMLLGWTYMWADKPDLPHAIEHFKASIARDPDFWWSHLFLGWCLDLQGKPGEAVLELTKAKAGGSSLVLGYMGYRLARSGDRAGAEALLKQLLELKPSPEGYPSPHHIAMVYAGLGDQAKTLEWLNKAKEGREEIMLMLEVDPTWAPFRDSPGFKALLKEVHARG